MVMSVVISVVILADGMIESSSAGSECKRGTFRCGDLNTCVSREKFCDKVMDCENGFDESFETCCK